MLPPSVAFRVAEFNQQQRTVVVAGGASAADLEYGNVQPFCYGAVLMHFALRGGQDFDFWRQLPGADRHATELGRVRDLVLKAAPLV